MPLVEVFGKRPRIAERVFIASNATVIGDVEIGPSSSMWFGAVVRGDIYPIRIGARTNIQDNAVVHVTGGESMTSIGDDVTVGHLACLHGCTVGDRCLVGMGSFVLDGAVIEPEAFIAAGTLVPPGMRIPSRSLAMGRPAKVVRSLRDDELANIRSAAEHYVAYAEEYLAKSSIT